MGKKINTANKDIKKSDTGFMNDIYILGGI